MKKQIRHSFMLVIMSCFLLTTPSCVDEDDYDFDKLSEKVDWTPNMIVPAGTGTYDLWYLLNQHEANPEDATIVLGTDGLLHIIHTEKDIFSYQVSEILNFPAQSPDGISIPLPGPLVGVSLPIPAGTQFTFGASDIFRLTAQTSGSAPILKQVKVSTGINFTVTNPLSEEITLKVTLPDGTLAGTTPAEFTAVIPANSTPSQSWDLSDLTINFPNPSVNNELELKFEAEITASGNPVSSTGSQMDISYSFDPIIFELATGDFGKQTIDIGSGDIDLAVDFWDDIEGSFQFYDPKINMVFRNGVGVPFEINADLTGFNKDGESVALNPDPLRPDYPTNEGEIDVIEPSTVTYDRNNSEIVALMALPPDDRITYSGTIDINYSDEPVDINTQPNIVKSNSSIEVDMEIDIPLEFSATNLSLQDTIDDLDISDAEKIINGKLVIVTENGLPLAVTLVKISLTDAEFQEIANIETEKIFEAAAVFPASHEKAGQVDPSKIKEQSSEIIFPKETIAKLNDAKNIIIEASINTSNEGTVPVKLMGSDKIVFKLAVQAQLDLNK